MKFDYVVTNEPEPGQEKCDFCSSRQKWTVYDCHDFEVMQFRADTLHVAEHGEVEFKPNVNWHSQSRGAWVACHECAKLIDAGQWKELLERALEHMIEIHPILKHHRAETRRKLNDLHQQFRRLMRKAN